MTWVLDQMQTIAQRKVVSLDAYHQHSIASWWVTVDRVVRDCIKNPYLLESNAHTLRGAFGERAYNHAIEARDCEGGEK